VIWVVGYLVFTATLIMLAVTGLAIAFFRKRPPFGPEKRGR
jgi:hypothetical protein